MTAYDIFSKHYDEVMGDRSGTAAMLDNLIKKNNPNAKTVLEIACGTGSILKYFAKKYKVYGFDISRGMLSLAKRSVPSGTFSRQNMVSFRFSERFDVILCVFDSVNHLLKFSDWIKMFTLVKEHLNKGGLFIFDMNTDFKLQKKIKSPAWVLHFGKHLMILKVLDDGNGISNWNVKVFQNISKNKYTLYEEDIREKSFPLRKVKEALKLFRKVVIIDTSRKHPSIKSERLFFICRK